MVSTLPDFFYEIGAAVGLEMDDNAFLRTTEILEERDDRRWDLDPESSEDYQERRDWVLYNLEVGNTHPSCSFRYLGFLVFLNRLRCETHPLIVSKKKGWLKAGRFIIKFETYFRYYRFWPILIELRWLYLYLQ